MQGPETATAITAAVEFYRQHGVQLDTIRMDNQSSPEARAAANKLSLKLVTLAGTAQYPWVLRQSRYCGYCRWVIQVLWVLRVLWMYLGTAQYPWVGTVGTARGESGSWVLRQYPWVLQGTVGTARGESGSWVLRQYPWVLQGTVGTVGTAQGKSGSWVLWQYPWVLWQYPWVLWVLHGVKVAVGYSGSSRGYCRVLWVLRVL
jgi:hypothetical protein